jgi:hypothetical protein
MDKLEKTADYEQLIKELNHHYDLQLAEQPPSRDLEALLAEKLNELIRSDFNMLVTILYRIDVSEEKLKKLLKDNAGEDAGRIMARLIIERQLQKIKARRASDSSGSTSAWKD